MHLKCACSNLHFPLFSHEREPSLLNKGRTIEGTGSSLFTLHSSEGKGSVRAKNTRASQIRRAGILLYFLRVGYRIRMGWATYLPRW